MIKEALQYIVGLKEPAISFIDGHQYSDKPLTLISPPMASSMHVTTLSALILYLKSNNDALPYDMLTAHVVSPTTVRLLSALSNDRIREIYITAEAQLPSFKFGIFYDSESFNIALQSMFVDSGDRRGIIKMAGNITEENIKTSTDDGKTQAVVVRTGAKVRDIEEVPNPVSLSPYRTFTEVEQPESNFVFRVHDGGCMALFEADGGAWRNVAMQNIKNYLEEAFKELNIDIAVLA